MLTFWLSIGALSLVQGALVALPGRQAPMALLGRFQGRWWALVLPLSIVVVIGGIALDSASARFLTWLALIAVPLIVRSAMTKPASRPKCTRPRTIPSTLASCERNRGSSASGTAKSMSASPSASRSMSSGLDQGGDMGRV